jgi:hypothetical protein
MDTKLQDKLRSLQARALSLNRTLEDLKNRRDRGRVDLGQYTDLSTDLERERIEILMEIKTFLGGKNQQLDHIIGAAINGESDDVLFQQMAVVAEEKGFGKQMVDQLNEHKGTIVSWLIEIGTQLISHV